jgi:hypothetical protein
MASVGVNPPKTPVTKGSSGTAAATLPNVCKMPGPPAPFVPTPLPNIGTSDDSPQGYSTSVKIEGQPVAIQGASFKSKGDIASQGTGGGLVSNNVQGPTKFVGPGSFDVKIEGKNTQLLSDQMLNNCGPGGSPPNAATMMGVAQATGSSGELAVHEIECDVEGSAKAGWNCCQMKQFCAKLDAVTDTTRSGKATTNPTALEARNRNQGEGRFRAAWNAGPYTWQPLHHKFYHRCAFEQAAANDFQIGSEFQPDHIHELQLGGRATDFKNLKWIDTSVNRSLGSTLSGFDPATCPGGVSADCCPAEERNCAGKADTDPVLP